MANLIPSIESWVSGTDIFDGCNQPERLDEINSFAFTTDPRVTVDRARGINAFFLSDDGHFNVFGSNFLGILGNGRVNNQIAWVDQLFELRNFRIVDLRFGEDYAVLLTLEGNVYCWGQNENSQLGIGKDQRVVLNPFQLSSFITAIDCGFKHTLLLSADRCVHAFGLNDRGQVGNGKAGQNVSRPYRVLISDFDGQTERMVKIETAQVAAGSYHSLALSLQGEVWSWGDNQCGQLGRSIFNRDDSYHPGLVVLLSRSKRIDQPRIVRIAASHDNSAVLSSRGAIYVWGTVRGSRNKCSLPLLVRTSHWCFDLLISQDLFVAVSRRAGHCLVWGRVSSQSNGQHATERILVEPMNTLTTYPADAIRVYGDRLKSPFMFHVDPLTPRRPVWENARPGERTMISQYQHFRRERGICSPRFRRAFLRQVRHRPEMVTGEIIVRGYNTPLRFNIGLLRLRSAFFNALARFHLLSKQVTDVLHFNSYSRATYEEYLNFLNLGELKAEESYASWSFMYRVTFEVYDLANGYLEFDLKELCLARLLRCLDILPWSFCKTGNDLFQFGRFYRLSRFQAQVAMEVDHRLEMIEANHAQKLKFKLADIYSNEYIDFSSKVLMLF